MFRFAKRAVNTRKSVALVQRRAMSGGHHNAPPPTGFEAKVRAVFPEDHQIVLATLGTYVGIYALVKMVMAVGGSNKEEKEEQTVRASTNESAIPSLLDDEFDKWSKIPGNMERWEKSLETLGQ